MLSRAVQCCSLSLSRYLFDTKLHRFERNDVQRNRLLRLFGELHSSQFIRRPGLAVIAILSSNFGDL